MRDRARILLLCLVALLLAPACRETSTQAVRPEVKTLPAPRLDGDVSLEAAIAARRSVREYAPTPLTWEELGQLAWAGQGITDSETGYRAAPSAGALYPIELVFITQEGAYHYLPEGHAMKQLLAGDTRPALREVALGQGSVAAAPAVIVIAGIPERTTVKYGDRSERYMLLEAGHVAQNIALQATALGLGLVTIGAFQDDQVAEVLDLPEGWQPLYILPVGRPAQGV